MVDGVVVAFREEGGVELAVGVDAGEGRAATTEEGAEDNGIAVDGEVGVAAHAAAGDIHGVGGGVARSGKAT